MTRPLCAAHLYLLVRQRQLVEGPGPHGKPLVVGGHTALAVATPLPPLPPAHSLCPLRGCRLAGAAAAAAGGRCTDGSGSQECGTPAVWLRAEIAGDGGSGRWRGSCSLLQCLAAWRGVWRQGAGPLRGWSSTGPPHPRVRQGPAAAAHTQICPPPRSSSGTCGQQFEPIAAPRRRYDTDQAP